jgi:hypothetical protein
MQQSRNNIDKWENENLLFIIQNFYLYTSLIVFNIIDGGMI